MRRFGCGDVSCVAAPSCPRVVTENLRVSEVRDPCSIHGEGAIYSEVAKTGRHRTLNAEMRWFEANPRSHASVAKRLNVADF